MDWFSLSTKVLDREDLNIYEKMCYVYLARFFQEEKESLTTEMLAQAMGVEEIVAKGAFFALRTKGIISSESSISPGTIIKAKDMEKDILERVCDLIEEPINAKEAKIILNFAGGDLDKIKEKYKIAKASQFQDKIEVLIHELQKKTTSKIIKEGSEPVEKFDFDETESETSKEVVGTQDKDMGSIRDHKSNQVNTYQINQMRKYQKK
jgi:hypothetical protein